MSYLILSGYSLDTCPTLDQKCPNFSQLFSHFGHSWGTLKHGLKYALDALAHSLDSPWVANGILGSCQSLESLFSVTVIVHFLFMAKPRVNDETFLVRRRL